MAQTREKFATQVNSEMLAAVRSLSIAEGRQLQALVEEAFADLLEKRKRSKPRAHVERAEFLVAGDMRPSSWLNDRLPGAGRSNGHA
jgi:hypothetical protein